MLTFLELKNYIFIENLKLEPSSGLNIFTGETGAGKSIIIEAISLICGERPQTYVVGNFSEKCELTAILEASPQIRKILESLEISYDNDEIIIRREIDKQNKSKFFLNDRLVTTNLIKTLFDGILDIHGQNEHQKLLLPSYQLEAIDKYSELEKKIEEYTTLFLLYKKKKQQKDNLKSQIIQKKQQLDILNYQISEIEQAKLTEEDEQIETELDKAKNAQKVLNMISEIKFNISEIKNNFSNIQRIIQNLKPFINIQNQFIDTIYSEIENFMSEVEKLKKELSSYTPETIDSLVDRVDLIKKLKRKYGNSISEIKKYYETTKLKLQQIEVQDKELEILETEIKNLENKLLKLASELSKNRIEKGKTLTSEINKELSTLGLQKAKIKIDIQTSQLTVENLNPFGIDKAEFLILTNPGVPFGPLKNIASGGELSRIMLAIKTVLGRKENTPILIFDEIDSGIGGPMGFIIGNKLKNLSLKGKQIFCITHLAQIASFADKHFFVKKVQQKGTTSINVEVLNEEKRKKEIARMISGSKIDETSLNHAEKLLKDANESFK
ncbi:MAG: DNA repair protein RecN [Endomicrobia bacterium]|nr:DNA repair protein RecN [Endomicrobiia bacterium]